MNKNKGLHPLRDGSARLLQVLFDAAEEVREGLAFLFRKAAEHAFNQPVPGIAERFRRAKRTRARP